MAGYSGRENATGRSVMTKRPANSAEQPQARGVLWSVVVPVYEQWHMVTQLLSALAEQRHPLDQVEVILVDNGSTKRPQLALLPPYVTILECATPGSYAARNTGAKSARGRWLLFTDADCRPDPGWLTAIVAEVGRLDGKMSLLAGPVEVRSGAPSPNIFEIYDMVRGIPQARYVRRGYAATANLAVPTALFHQMGGFDGQRLSGGDAEFCRRAGAEGAQLRFLPAAIVHHPARKSWTELATKARRVKGGQLVSGTRKRRLAWSLATLAPPWRESFHLLTCSRSSFRDRIIAVCIQHALWSVQILELIRLAFGARPERR